MDFIFYGSKIAEIKQKMTFKLNQKIIIGELPYYVSCIRHNKIYVKEC